MEIVEKLKEFKTSGLSFLEKMPKDVLNEMIRKANAEYHTEALPVLTDSEYDVLREYVEQTFPNVEALQEIGATIKTKQKVILPVNMPSMDKIKPDSGALEQWTNKYKGPYVLSCKLDGVSGLFSTMESTPKLFTRGNGTVGQDVSHLIKPLGTFPKVPHIMVRGEFIIKKRIFEENFSSSFANIRNMVAGMVNRKTHDESIHFMEFVAYEVIHPVLVPSKQMNFLRDNGFTTVFNETHHKISNEMLSKRLVEWRTNYEYEIDGIIVSNDDVYKRSSSNPDHSFAFKMVISDQVVETHVTDVVWTASKDGYLKPRIRVNPVKIGGVKIEYATGFNAQFIESNKIGVGAIVQIVRSGDVIPYIREVTTPAENAKMPEANYVWTDSHVDIVLVNKEEDSSVLEKQITLFFTTLGVEGLSSGNVKKLIRENYNTIPKILRMHKSDFLKIDGFQEKLSTKLLEGIAEKIENSSLEKLIVASGTLGRGLAEKKIKPILKKYPTILSSNETRDAKISMLLNVEGIGKENAKTFVDNIPHLLRFLQECNLQHRLNVSTEEVKKDKTHLLYGKKIVLTGFRDASFSKEMEERFDISFSSSVSKNTFCLIVKSKTDKSSKIEQAQKHQIPIVTVGEFKEKYL